MTAMAMNDTATKDVYIMGKKKLLPLKLEFGQVQELHLMQQVLHGLQMQMCLLEIT